MKQKPVPMFARGVTAKVAARAGKKKPPRASQLREIIMSKFLY